MIKHNPRLSRQVMVKSMSKTSGKSKKDLKLLRDECDRLHKRNTELRVRLAERFSFSENTKEMTKHKAFWYIDASHRRTDLLIRTLEKSNDENIKQLTELSTLLTEAINNLDKENNM
tara:strand:+ start:2798 stop:3148 length:351 start_codon:yes stop_codon:yes gene_type:complete